jgi:hypothetical protein
MIMPIIEDLKEYAERATGLRRPGKRAVKNFVRQRKPRPLPQSSSLKRSAD